ncbi:MAG: SDR family NAD(P)-dependent oxidoreductase [Pseudomonadota bacterium]
MTEPIAPPPRKDPQKRTRTSLLPPVPRSRAALQMSAAAARGELSLQVCAVCGHLTYPPRDACLACLSASLHWQPVPEAGQILAETTVRTTTDAYFRERTPWRVGTVRLDAGPVLMAHLQGDVTAPARCRVRAMLDKSGNAVLIALPEEDTPNMADDPQFRELTATPKHRRVLITDGRTAVGQAVAQAISESGASTVFVGIATPWLPFDGQDRLNAIPNAEIVPLDVTDANSVRELAGEIGGKTDILINTADHVRPGGVLNRQGLATTRDEFEVNVFGLQRLAQHFGPGMVGRGADGIRAAVALVDILPVYALANWREFGAHSASAAARHSLLQCLRGEMRTGGVRVMSVFTGPVDDDWRQPLPPPKVAPEAIARALIQALENGTEETFVGDIAKDVATRWRDDPKVLERELQG